MKKYIAPLVCGIIVVILSCLYFFIFVKVFDNMIVKVLYGLVVVVLIAAMASTINARFKEIKEEEKDDISKY